MECWISGLVNNWSAGVLEYLGCCSEGVPMGEEWIVCGYRDRYNVTI